MTRDSMRWEQLATYPPRPFVRYRADASGPLRIARRSPTGGRPTTVSILIPTLDADRGGYLPRLLDQLDDQTYRDWELLLVAGDRRQGRALNVAASLATGAYLLTLDDDTRLISPRALESVVTAADADP
ncbi:MAG: glycosyltransferase family 2 protein, partial [Actinobacteria bacterium]